MLIFKKSFLILILMLCSGLAYCQPDVLSARNINTVEFQLQYDFHVTGNTSKILFRVPVPISIPDRQEVLDVKYSVKPRRIHSKDSNNYAEFLFSKPKERITVKIDVKAKLYRYDLSIARKSEKDPLLQDDLKSFLAAEKYIEADDPLIQQAAGGLKGTDELSTVKNIYEYVIDSITYSGYLKADHGAVYALKKKKGDCSEYSYLFAALCRANNIPAKFVEGYAFDGEKEPRHDWVEVYLEKYGWVPFDPAKGDVEHAGLRKKRFQNLMPVYVYLPPTNDEKRIENYHYIAYWYWGDKVQFKDQV
ncbi:MAG: transglutaminase domain-containing protein, partial [Sedimentisphaerales bacterium]|nr:transglutaminase domain-containing protein [Sedimentisphaerales bacterium]